METITIPKDKKKVFVLSEYALYLIENIMADEKIPTPAKISFIYVIASDFINGNQSIG